MQSMQLAYGLAFQSDIPLPEFLPVFTGSPDVVIREVGELSGNLNAPIDEHFWQASSDRFVQRVPQVADFMVENGRSIEFFRSPQCEDREVRAYLLGSVIAALLQQRGFLTLHAATLHTKEGAILFMGKSGIGKSTLLNAFLKRGYSMMSDDVTAITLTNQGCPVVIAGFPRTRLWSDSVAKLDYELQSLERVFSNLEKYNISAPSQFFNGSMAIRHVFVLSSHNQKEISHQRQSPSQSFEWLQQYTYRKRFVRGNSLMKNQFGNIAAMSKQTPLTVMQRPSCSFLLDDLVEQVIDIIGNDLS